MGPQRSIKLRLAGGKKEGNICLPQEELTTTVCTVVQTDKTSLGEDMLPRAVAGDQLVGDLPSMHEALVQPPAPHKPGMGVQACELALGDGEKKDYKFKVIQGLDYSRPCFRDSKKEKGMRRGQRGSISGKVAQHAILSWYFGEGGHSHPILHRTSSLSSSSSSPAVPASHWAPLRKLSIHTNYCNYCQPLPPQEILMGSVNVEIRVV